MKKSQIPDLIYQYIPNKCETNSHGYRDYNYSYEKEQGMFRIVIIGDSVAQGNGVQLKDSFGKVLERKLNSITRHNKSGIEVIVLSMTGYSTSQELILLKNEAFRYDPDLILWSYILNDPAHPVYHNANGELGRYFYQPKSHFWNFVSKKIFAYNEKIKGKGCPKEYHKLLHCVYWDQVESHIKEIGSISKNKSIPILFLIHPVFEKEKTFDEYSLALLHKKLEESASQEGLITLDILNAYKAYNPDKIKLHDKTWYDPWHPNTQGHMIIAEYIYNSVMKGGYMKKWFTETGLDENGEAIGET